MQVECQFGQFSVLTSAQGFTPFTNVLPMQTENCPLNRQLLVDLFYYVVAQSKYTYILDKCPVLLCVSMLMTYGSLFLPLSILQTLSRRCTVQIQHLLNSYISIPVSSTASTLSFDNVSSSGAHIGGGRSRIARATIQPYIVSQPSTLNDRSILSYVAYVEKSKVKAYPDDQFVHADIAPLVV
jgi:hypothetical protein